MEVSLQVAKVPEEGQKTQESDVLMTCAFTMVPPLLLLVQKRHQINVVEGVSRPKNQKGHPYQPTQDNHPGRRTYLRIW